MQITTIIARNYLAYARTLSDSVRRHNPDATVSVLVVDAEPGDLADERFDVVVPADLDLDPVEFRRMALIYSVLELSTALKPWLLRLLLERGAPSVLYFDPDIEVHGPVDDLAELAAGHGIVLTPHTLQPMARDGRTPAEQDILLAGVYNLGFIGVGPKATAFLGWWSDRLRRDCVSDVSNGLFVDQRWVDFVPGYWDHHIVTDPGCNVAYWNLNERGLEATEDGYAAGGRPLRFFHFSGFAPERPHLLSKYPLDTPRVLLSELPAVAELCAGYMERLRANGYDECIGLPYTFDRTADGLRLDFGLRALARFELKDAEAEGREPRVPDPFELEGAREFRRWANEPDPSAPRFTRYLVALHRKRPDIAHAFPDLRGWDGERYKEFLLDPNRPEPLIDEQLLAPLRRPEPEQRPDSAWTPGGVNVAGYFRAETGVGEGARLLVNALKTAGVPSAVVSFPDPHNRQEDPFVVPPGEAVYDTNIVCVNADQLPRFAGTVGAPLLDGRYTIGMWAWEVEEFPVPHRASAHLVDEIWMGSRHSAAAVGRYVNKPVLSFPLPVVVPEPPRLDRHTLGLPEGYVFLFCFDYASVAERKNPVGLIEAFCRAFSPGEGPTLVLKSVNGHRHITESERVRAAAGGRPDIVIRDGYVPAGHQHALIAACDAYVSLHRAEGFGLTMAEAMALGKPVVATAYSGNLEYMDERNSFLVPADLVPIPPGCDPYPTTARWANPDLDAAAEAMRRVHEDPAEAARRARRAADDIRRDHGPAAAVPFLVARLEVARRSRPGRVPAPNPDMQRLLDGPDIHSATNRGALAHAFRKGVLRVLQHYRDHQRRIDHALLERIDDLEARRRADLASISAQLHSGLENLRRWADERQSTVDHLADRVARLDDEITAGPYLSDRDALVTTDDEGREIFGYRNGPGEAASPAEVYRRVEDLFRGPEPFIRDRQRVYLDLLAAHQPVVDLGCGRGEILDLLVEAGVEHVGIDLDEGMVARCRQKGHNVEHADGLAWMRQQPDGSLGAVFSAQFVEHIGRDDLMALLRESHRALRPGGLFVAETVNPHSSRALKAFWLDLTHVHPIYPEMALALCQLTGYPEASILFPNGCGKLEVDRPTEGEYAVVARR